jgi:hypothetical protein
MRPAGRSRSPSPCKQRELTWASDDRYFCAMLTASFWLLPRLPRWRHAGQDDVASRHFSDPDDEVARSAREE